MRSFYHSLEANRRADLVLEGISLISQATLFTSSVLSRGQVNAIVRSLKEYTAKFEKAFEEDVDG